MLSQLHMRTNLQHEQRVSTRCTESGVSTHKTLQLRGSIRSI